MITLKNVSKWYGHFQVLTDCSTEVKKGEVVVVCGPSGSGKSTLIKTVNGLEPSPLLSTYLIRKKLLSLVKSPKPIKCCSLLLKAALIPRR